MTTKLIIDSTCDLPEWIIKKFRLEVLPLIVTLENKSYRDNIDIQLEEVYGAMKKGIVPKTSQVPPEAIYTLFTEHCEAGHDLIYVSISSELSGTFQLATMIANELREKYPSRKLTVIDSKGGSMGTGLIALQACFMIERGAGYDAVCEYVKKAADHIEHFFIISNLEWLSKGGRIPKSLGKVGNLLNIKPLLKVENGKVALLQMVRGQKKALRTLLEKVSERIDHMTDQYIGITHADDAELAKKVEEMVKTAFPGCRTFVKSIGAAMGVHLGIGGVGIFFFNEKPEPYFYLD